MKETSKDTRYTYVAGIMAAGRGQRIMSLSKSKPMTSVGGLPLIEHVIRQCLQAGITELIVSIRPDDYELEDFLKKENRFPMGVKIVYVPEDIGTGGTLQTLTQKIGKRHCLISTADTIAPHGAYSRLISHAKKIPFEISSVILVTSYIQDEDPIWVVKDENDQIFHIAKKITPTGLVFGNVRWLSGSVTNLIGQLPLNKGNRDMLIMAELIKNPETIFLAYKEDPIFDVDDPSDVESANKWLQKYNSDL